MEYWECRQQLADRCACEGALCTARRSPAIPYRRTAFFGQKLPIPPSNETAKPPPEKRKRRALPDTAACMHTWRCDEGNDKDPAPHSTGFGCDSAECTAPGGRSSTQKWKRIEDGKGTDAEVQRRLSFLGRRVASLVSCKTDVSFLSLKKGSRVYCPTRRSRAASHSDGDQALAAAHGPPRCTIARCTRRLRRSQPLCGNHCRQQARDMFHRGAGVRGLVSMGGWARRAAHMC